MPTFSGAGGALRRALVDNYVVHPWVQANQTYTGVSASGSAPSTYLVLHILEGEAVAVAINGPTNTYRHPGVVKVSIRVPINTGDGLAREIADDLAAILRGQVLSGVHLRAPYFTAGEPDGAYWLATLTCPFHYDLTA